MSTKNDPCHLVKSNDVSILTLQNSVKIQQARVLKMLLLDAIEVGKPIRLDMHGLTNLDVTTIQLIYAAKTKAQNSDLEFNIFPISEPAKEILRTSGALYEIFTSATK